MQLKVIKTDGSIEEYLHTKVFGTLSNALAMAEESNIFAAEQFAEAITFYLYRNENKSMVSSDEIHLLTQAVLEATGYANAAISLKECHLIRKLKRRRIEVIDDTDGTSMVPAGQWSKTRIVDDLIKDGFSRHVARAIASSVEEKVLNIGMSRIRQSLVDHLVRADTETMAQAHMALQR